MAAKELQQLTDVARHDAKNAAGHFEMQAIFNRHATDGDAITSADQISSRSLVFIEGLQHEAPEQVEAKSIGDAIDIVSQAHLRGLINDTQFREHSANLFDDIDMALAGPDEGDYFSLQLYRSLLEKECDIVLADYTGYAAIGAEGKKFMQGAEEHAGGVVNQYILSGEMKKSKGVYRHTNELFRASMMLSAFHHTREKFAVAQMTRIMQAVISNSLTPHLDRSKNGLISTSVIYGTSHKNSLTRKMADSGFNVIPVVLDNIHEADCIDEEMYIYGRRRLGYEVLKAVYLYGVGHGSDEVDETKDKLYLYSTDVEARSEERWDMFARGIRSLHDISHQKESGYEEAHRLISNVVDRAGDVTSVD